MNRRLTRRIFVKTSPTDLRKGFGGLYSLVITYFKKDLLKGDTFLFLNKRKTLIKMIQWDGTGVVITSKMLAKGRFANLFDHFDGKTIHMSKNRLQRLMAGESIQRIFLPGKTSIDRVDMI